MDRRHFIKSMLVLAGGLVVPVSVLKAKELPVKIWGQKTLRPRAEVLRSMRVRRLLLYIERHVREMMWSFRYQCNDQVSRDAMIKLTNSLCLDLKQNGARVYDYNTICDPSNNTPEMVDRNEVKLDLFIKFSPALEEPIHLSFHLKPHRFDVAKEIS